MKSLKISRKRFIFLMVLSSLLIAGGYVSAKEQSSAVKSKDINFFPGDYSKHKIIGNSLPGAWRPFSDKSPWNTPVPDNALTHPDSKKVMSFVLTQAKNIRLARIYVVPVWVVNSKNMPHVKVKSKHIFDTWDKDRKGWSDDGIPVTRDMWAEPTDDGHLSIVDPFKMTAWEFSRFGWLPDNKTPKSTTFNIWDLKGDGFGNPFEGKRWQTRGGRGSGFPLIAGMIRPEELAAGEIRHAMVFTFPMNRQADDGSDIFLLPACRSDGKYKGSQYPIEGMRFQLNPLLTEKDFDKWGLNREGKIVARALQKYGMYLGDNGGAMALQVQLLGQTEAEHLRRWEELFPGFYKNVARIPTDRFRIVYTGEPIVKK